MDLRSFLSEELWFFLLISVLLGVTLPDIGLYVTPYAMYLLLALMFVTCLGIGLSDIKKAAADREVLIKSLLLIFVISPIIALPMALTLDKETALGFMLYAAIPTAMSNALYIKMMGRNAALALMVTAVTTLLAPFATPLIINLLTGVFVQVNTLELFISLAKYILVPFALAEVFRRYAKNATKGILKHSKPVGNLLISLVVFGLISAAGGRIWDMGQLVLVMFAFFGISFFLGYVSCKRERFVVAFGNSYRNGTLAMVVAAEVFGPAAGMAGVLSALVHNIIFVPVMFWGKKAGKAKT